MSLKKIKVSILVALAVVVAMAVTFVLPPGTKAVDDDKKKIKLKLEATVTHGQTPLPVHFVAAVDADSGLDEYLYESSNEWVIEGKFVLTNRWTGGNPQSDPNMRGTPLDPEEANLYNTKHLVSKTRNRRPHKKYEKGMEIKRSYEYDFTFEKAGEYFVTFRLRNGKYSSNIIRILVKGDTTYDPMRDPY